MSYQTCEDCRLEHYKCEGSHASLNIKHEGPLELHICADPHCARIFAKCEHALGIYPNQTNLMVWNSEGTVLTCSYCGRDGT